jgi:hypothetical protein
MPDPIKAAAVHQRWEELRTREDCDLSLAPEAVERYLKEKESEIVKQRILESLLQFAEYRIREGPYHSGNQGGGDLATCEGLETFLVPAVEEAYEFSKFLRKCPAADGFVAAFKDDLKGLLRNWTKEKPEFSGRPYTDTGRVKRFIEPASQQLYAPYSITETAAMACRVVIHLLTLKCSIRKEDLFNEMIGKDLDDDLLLKALANGIDFLVDAFQKTGSGSDEEKIANTMWGDVHGSGWSWTKCPPGTPGLAPMLFFTAAAVDAFAELDLYLIRPARANEFKDSAPRVQQFFQEKQQELRQLQLCVDMARRWVRTAVLPNLTRGTGQHQERYADKTPMINVDQPALKSFESDWKKAGLAAPTLYYNNLYALQILLWSFGDRTDDGKSVDETAKSYINGAITLLVYNYDSLPFVKQALSKARHKFFLPGRGVFNCGDEEAACEYEDAGFLPLLTRLLVLFVVYGVGDRNLLEPIIRALYVELMQKRNRMETSCSALWSTEEVEVYSTQRAVQALTFYHAYAAGRERVEAGRGRSMGDGAVVLRNRTGMQIVLELVQEGDSPVTDPPPPPQPDPAAAFQARFGESFPKYTRQIPGFTPPPPPVGNDDENLQKQVEEFAESIFSDGRAGKLPQTATAERLLHTLAGLLSQPWDGKRLRQAEFETVRKEYSSLIAPTTGAVGK